jgi:hypothetical protein
VAVLADDDVVVHGDAERPAHVDDGLGHLDVCARGRRIARGMIVHEGLMRCPQLQRRWCAD